MIFVTFQWLQSVEHFSCQHYPTFICNNKLFHELCLTNKAQWTSFLFKHGSWYISFTCLSFCSCKMTSHTVEEKTLMNKLFIIYIFLYFHLSFLVFPSFCSFYCFFFYSFFSYFILQPMLILTDLFWCQKFQLHFMSLVPQKKGTLIKIECFKTKPCPSQ